MNARRYILLAATTAVLFLAGVPAALATTFTVDSVAIGGGDTSPGDAVCEDTNVGTSCTLKAAIDEANANANADTIGFSAAITEPVQMNAALTISQPVTVDGCSSDPNHAGPCTELHTGGGNIGLLDVAAPAVTIRGLALTGGGSKLKTTAAADNLTLKNNWFGFALDGAPGDFGSATAIEIQGDDATIGGTGGATGSAPADRNVISNSSIGVELAADGAVVQGNFIGTGPAGGSGPGGVGVGIKVLDDANVHQPADNLIGGTANATTAACDSACNVISDVSQTAINLDTDTINSSALTTFADSTTIRGNYIGTDVSGTQNLGIGAGIFVGRADFTTIGGPSVHDRNLIGGSTSVLQGGAVRVLGGDNTTIQNNRIGVGSGGQAIPNATTAIDFNQFSPTDEAVNANVGGDTTASENVISNSGEDAIRLGPGVDNVTIGRNTGNSNGDGAGDEFIDLIGLANNQITPPAITAAKTSGVNGSGAASGATIRVFQTKGEHGDIARFLGSTTATANGSWSFTHTQVVKLGQFVTATQTNPGTGDDTSELAPVVRSGQDAAFPTAFIEEGPTQSSTIEDNTPTWRFSSSMPAATFECRYDADAFASCPNPFTGAAALADGAHTLSMRARVGANVSPAIARTFTVDTGTDTAITAGPAGGSSTADTTPTFEFSSPPDPTATFECKIDAAAFGPCSGPGNAHTPAVALTQGLHTFRVRATDAVGHVDASPAVRNFTVDTIAPDTAITSGPLQNSRTTDTTPTFGFSSTEANSTFECKLDGAAFGPCSGPGAKHTPPALAEGQHTFRVRAIDPAGNVDGTAVIRSFVVDLTKPETTITSGPAEGSTTADRTPTFGFSSNEASSTFECRIDGAAFAPCSGPGATHTTASLGDGQHTLRVRAKDGAGNIDSTPAVRTFKVDAP